VKAVLKARFWAPWCGGVPTSRERSWRTLCLRQQLAVLRRATPRPAAAPTRTERFWSRALAHMVALARANRNRQPATVIAMATGAASRASGRRRPGPWAPSTRRRSRWLIERMSARQPALDRRRIASELLAKLGSDFERTRSPIHAQPRGGRLAGRPQPWGTVCFATPRGYHRQSNFLTRADIDFQCPLLFSSCFRIHAAVPAM